MLVLRRFSDPAHAPPRLIFRLKQTFGRLETESAIPRLFWYLRILGPTAHERDLKLGRRTETKLGVPMRSLHKTGFKASDAVDT